MTQTLNKPTESELRGRYANAAEWLHALGDVPLERIVFDPWPGTATEEDVTRLDDHDDRLCELIDGTLVEKAMGLEESLIAGRIIFLLSLFMSERKLGVISSPDGMLRILPDRVRIPDVAFISFARLPGGRVPKDPVPSLAPDLAVEVLSDSNTRNEMSIKLREYFTAGVRLVWYVDPKTRSVDVYTGPQEVRKLSGDDLLSGGDVLPGFEVKVSAIFDVAP